MDRKTTEQGSLAKIPIKILYVTHGGGSGKMGLPSGSTRVVVNIVNAHSDKFAPVVVFLGQDAGGSVEAKQALKSRGVKYYDIEWHGRGNIAAILTSLPRLYRILRDEQPAVVCLNGVPGTYLGWLPARWASVRQLLAVVHNLPSDRKEKLLARFLRFSDHIVYVSQGLYTYYSGLGLSRRPRHSVVSNGIDLSQFAYPTSRGFRVKPYYISMSARLNVPKDPVTLLKALALLRKANHPLRLRFIGDGPQCGAIETLAFELGVREQVEITGYTDRVSDFLKDSDIFVLSTRWEGQPLAIIEAMAAGLPIVASRVVGVSDIIQDQQTGLLVPPEDPVALAEAIEQLLNNPEAALEMGQRAKSYATSHFDIRRMTQEYESLILELLNRHAHRN